MSSFQRLNCAQKNCTDSEQSLANYMHRIQVSLVYATREKQYIYEASIARGSEALDLVIRSGFLDQLEELNHIDVQTLNLGIYSQKISLDHLLSDGDRVEIYRPLKADPKEVRRQLALMGKTMGKAGNER